MSNRLIWDLKTGGRFVTDGWLRGRTVVLHGVDVAFTQDEKGLRMEPVIPCPSPLTDLVRANPEYSEFRWSGSVWEVA